MRRRYATFPVLFFIGLTLVLPAACSSSEHRVVDVPVADGGEAGIPGMPSAAGMSSEDGGMGGSIELGGSAGAAGLSNESGASNEAGAAGATGEPLPAQTVTAFGCFGLSGDGFDRFPNGQPAVNAINSPYGGGCNSSTWISDNAFAYAPATPPTTLVFKRYFVVDPAIFTNGKFSVSFKADDAVELIFNGQSVASCTPPDADHANACQVACTNVRLPADLLLGDGQINTLEVHLINLQSLSVDGTNYGYTATSYALCVANGD